MKLTINFFAFFILTAGFFMISGCSESDDPGKDLTTVGRIYFSPEPFVATNNEQRMDTLKFKIFVQFAAQAQPISVDYVISEGEKELKSEVVALDVSPEPLKIFFNSDWITWVYDRDQYGGKSVMVYLDPDHSSTSEAFQSEQYVDLYKRKTITLPE